MGIWRYYFLILLLVPILISISSAFALEQACPDCVGETGMSVSVNADEGSTIISVSGHTSIKNNSITIIAIAPNGNIVSVSQVMPDANGDFLIDVQVNSQWNQDGVYTIKVEQGTSSLYSFSLQVEVIGGVTSATSVTESTLESEPVQQIIISTSQSSYNEGETIIISGQVSVILLDAPMTVQIFNLGNLIEIVQLTVTQDGSFTHTLIAQGPQWQNTGEYVVRASYGEGNIAETTFQFFKIEAPSEISGFFEVDAGTGGTFDVGYSISGGTVKDMIVDSEIFALIVIIESTGDGGLTLDLPRESIDAKKSDGSDDLFIILIDGIQVIYDEAITNENTRTLTIRFEEGDSKIEILGTFIVNGGQPQPPEEPEPILLGPGEVSNPPGSSVPGCEETNECFIPSEITINVGDTVTWFNHDTAAHTVTSGSAADGPDGVFDSSLFMAGATFSWTAETAGEYPYHCMVHPWMAGVVNVVSDGSEEPTPEPHSLVASTDRTSYESGDIIFINGKTTVLNNDISIIVIAPNGNILSVHQVSPDNNGDFTVEITNTDSSLWKQTGTYTISIKQGSNLETNLTFHFSASGEPPSPSSIRVSIPAGTSVPGCEETRTCFIPFSVSVARGGTVIWSNDDTAAHTVTSGSPTDGPDGIFDSSLFMAGQTFSVTFDQDGTFQYLCMVHPWMTGQVIVGQGGPTPIPPSVNIRTDRSTYHPGETVEVSGIVRHFDGRAVSLKIVNPFGSLVLVDQVELSSGGTFNEQYKIAGPQWTKSGSYTITVQAGSAKAQTEFFLRIPSTVPPPSQQTTEIVVARGSSVPGCEETNQCFIPFEARVNVGDTVTWFNHDTAAHTVTSGSAADGPNGIFDSSLFMAGTEFSHTFDAAGEYEYFCMVHPWMAGVILVGEGGPVTRPPSNISISVESDKSVYDLGDLVEIDVSISGINSREQVAITVTDRSGTAVISRTLTTDSSGHAELEFRIPEDFRTGTYLVSATTSIDGKTYKARDVFKIKSQFNQIRIVSVEPTNQQGQLSDFEVGELGFVKVVLDADKDIAVLITVNLFDSELTTLGIGSLKTTLNDGRTEMILSFMIPDDAALGEAEIFASVFSDWPRNGGIPLTSEVSAEVDIR